MSNSSGRKRSFSDIICEQPPLQSARLQLEENIKELNEKLNKMIDDNQYDAKQFKELNQQLKELYAAQLKESDQQFKELYAAQLKESDQQLKESDQRLAEQIEKVQEYKEQIQELQNKINDSSR